MKKSGIRLILSGLLLALAGCGGDNSNPGSNQQHGSDSSGRIVLLDPTLNDATTPLGNLRYLPDGSATDGDGTFTVQGDELTLHLGSNTRLSLPASAVISQQDIATAFCRSNADPDACQYTAAVNLERFLLSVDADRNSANGIQLDQLADSLNLAWTDSPDRFEAALTRQLAPHGIIPKALFTPSLGINTEAPQAEADEVVQPMAFADIFRTARPFAEFSCEDAIYDANGWPGSLPPGCAGKNPAYIKTLLLQNVTAGMIPAGEYTVLYEGDGRLSYTGYGRLISHQPGRDVIDISFGSALKRLDVQLASGSVRNIRIVMPGGICEGNPFVRVENAAGCPAGAYRDFAATLAADRNAIVFNPDYLRVLKDFRTVRMMNLMEASPGFAACFVADPANPDGAPIISQDCLLQDFIWEQRGRMEDAVWGGSYRTPRTARYGRGVPLEVQVELANQLNADPWFNIVHNATDDYVREFAAYVCGHLKPGLKAHIEYTNEAWNSTFWAALYVREKGKGLFTAADNPFWDGAYFYARRASEIFRIWEDVFGSTERLVRILGTYQQNTDLTRNMLDFENTKEHVDVVAMGGYFYACWNRASNAACADTGAIPKTLAEATSLDDIFAAMDNENDPYGLSSLQDQFRRQASVARSFGKRLFVYEGGQHLTVHWGDNSISTARKNSLLDFFRAANRDSRMRQRYLDMLEAWKKADGGLFMLYTLPQSFHRFGTFGIKESLNQPRTSAPKYDAAMRFQEAQRQCWWDGC